MSEPRISHSPQRRSTLVNLRRMKPQIDDLQKAFDLDARIEHLYHVSNAKACLLAQDGKLFDGLEQHRSQHNALHRCRDNTLPAQDLSVTFVTVFNQRSFLRISLRDG
jgi:hypothetical protein